MTRSRARARRGNGRTRCQCDRPFDATGPTFRRIVLRRPTASLLEATDVDEALAVLEPGEPFVLTDTDAVKAAGHSCPTPSGADRLVQFGLDALYPDDDPVRSEIEVQAAGPRDDAAYGVTTRIGSYVTGSTEDDGFSGLDGGYGGRRELLRFDALDPDTVEPTCRLRRTDVDETVEVTSHVSDVADGGPAIGNLQGILDGSGSDRQREVFADAWHRRVQVVLDDDSLFTVDAV